MLKWIFIAVGGALGSVLRYAMQGWVGQQIAGRSFPIGTIVVNITGCLIIGLLAGFFDGPQLVREEYRVGLLVGVLGGYTTFSSFGLETFRLANDGEFRLALIERGGQLRGWFCCRVGGVSRGGALVWCVVVRSRDDCYTESRMTKHETNETSLFKFPIFK